MLKFLHNIRLYLWCRKYIKPLRNPVLFNYLDTVSLQDYMNEFGTRAIDPVSWDQIALRQLKAIIKRRDCEIGTWEYWEDPDDNPSWVNFATPGIMVPVDAIPTWMVYQGHVSPHGVFFPAYVPENHQ